MTQDDIIRMARERDLIEMDHDCLEGVPLANLPQLIELVRADEREACAQTCEQAGIDGYGTLAAAALIRKRSEA